MSYFLPFDSNNIGTFDTTIKSIKELYDYSVIIYNGSKLHYRKNSSIEILVFDDNNTQIPMIDIIGTDKYQSEIFYSPIDAYATYHTGKENFAWFCLTPGLVKKIVDYGASHGIQKGKVIVRNKSVLCSNLRGGFLFNNLISKQISQEAYMRSVPAVYGDMDDDNVADNIKLLRYTSYFNGYVAMSVANSAAYEAELPRISGSKFTAIAHLLKGIKDELIKFDPKTGVNAGTPPTMIGQVNEFAGSVPANYLPMDGRAVSRSIYDELFKSIGTKFGEGDSSTTFNIPNKQHPDPQYTYAIRY